MIYIDYVEFVFESIRDLEKFLLLILNPFSKFGLEMNIGRGPKPSKTECAFFPPPGFFKTSSNYSPAVDIDCYQINITEKKDNDKQKRKREVKAYDESNDTNIIAVSDGFVTTTKQFRYLGRFASYNLYDDYNFYRRLAPAS